MSSAQASWKLIPHTSNGCSTFSHPIPYLAGSAADSSSFLTSKYVQEWPQWMQLSSLFKE